jgi:hypothetical protein
VIIAAVLAVAFWVQHRDQNEHAAARDGAARARSAQRPTAASTRGVRLLLAASLITDWTFQYGLNI